MRVSNGAFHSHAHKADLSSSCHPSAGRSAQQTGRDAATRADEHGCTFSVLSSGDSLPSDVNLLSTQEREEQDAAS